MTIHQIREWYCICDACGAEAISKGIVATLPEGWTKKDITVHSKIDRAMDGYVMQGLGVDLSQPAQYHYCEKCSNIRDVIE